jgi:imidazolonepropionase-like amidohydrolase
VCCVPGFSDFAGLTFKPASETVNGGVRPALGAPARQRNLPHPWAKRRAPVQILFTNATLVTGEPDPASDWGGSLPQARPGMQVLVEGNAIREVSDRPITATSATAIDLKGSTLMPGLIDCHVHVLAGTLALGSQAYWPDTHVLLKALPIMRGMLDRGFTTVRDAAGAPYALATAQAEGLFVGPRLFVPGKGLSQTGGHGDVRPRNDGRETAWLDRQLGTMCRIANGVDEVRRACREELRSGAHMIKLMANGGVASPTDPIAFLQYSREEICAAVEEAAMAQTYTMAHLYTDEAIRRAVECGVHSLEHCNLIEAETAKLAALRRCIAVPTLVAYEGLAKDGARYGLPPESIAKIETVRIGGLNSLATMRAAGLPMAFGSDLLGELHPQQSDEFRIRAQVLPAAEILAGATTLAARLIRQVGKLGVVAPGAAADLLVVDGDPLSDITILSRPDQVIRGIMQDGRWHKALN